MKRSLPLPLSVGALVAAMVSIQTGATFAKSLFPLVGAQGTTALRLGFGALVLAVALRPWRTTFTRQNCQPVVLYGTTLGAMNLLFYLALERLPLGIAAALEFTGPLAVALLTSRRRLDFAWIGLATLGLLLLLPIRRAAHMLDPLGIIYALGAATCWALYIVFGQKAGAAHGSHTPALGMAIAAIVVLPVGIFHAGSALLTLNILPMTILVGILSSALPFTLEMIALRHLPAQTYGTLTSIEPAIGALSGLIFLHEMLPPFQWLAIALIIVASIGTTLTITAAKAPVAEVE